MNEFNFTLYNAIDDTIIAGMKYATESYEDGLEQAALIMHKINEIDAIQKYKMELEFKALGCDTSFEFIAGFCLVSNSDNGLFLLGDFESALKNRGFNFHRVPQYYCKEIDNLNLLDSFYDEFGKADVDIIIQKNNGAIAKEIDIAESKNEIIKRLKFKDEVKLYYPKALKVHLKEKYGVGVFPHYVICDGADFDTKVVSYDAMVDLSDKVNLSLRNSDKPICLRIGDISDAMQGKATNIIEAYFGVGLLLPKEFEYSEELSKYINLLKESYPITVYGLLDFDKEKPDLAKVMFNSLMKEKDTESGDSFHCFTLNAINYPFKRYNYNVGQLVIDDMEVGGIVNEEDEFNIMLNAFITVEAFRVFVKQNIEYPTFPLTQGMNEVSHKFNISLVADGRMIPA